MPTIRRPCPSCRVVLIASPQRLCPACTRRVDQARGSATSRGYSYTGTRRRAPVLAEQPICASPGCTLPSVDVDHVLSKRKGGTDDRSNLIAFCHRHHSQKTALTDGGFGRPVARIIGSGSPVDRALVKTQPMSARIVDKSGPHWPGKS